MQGRAEIRHRNFDQICPRGLQDLHSTSTNLYKKARTFRPVDLTYLYIVLTIRSSEDRGGLESGTAGDLWVSPCPRSVPYKSIAMVDGHQLLCFRIFLVLC